MVLRDNFLESQKRLNEIQTLFRENTDAVGKIQDELDEMPGGYRNSQDIKRLQKAASVLEEKLRSVSEVTVHSKLGDLEKIAHVMSKAVDDLNQADVLRSEQIAQDRQRLTKLEASNEQRKKDIKHAWNVANEQTEIIERLKSSVHVNGSNFHDHLIKHEKGTYDSPFGKRLDQLEECCKNTVSSGKALEEKVDNLSRQYSETLKFVRDTTGNIRQIVRDTLKSL